MVNTKKPVPPTPSPRHDWYLNEWLRQFDKIAADLEKELEWNKSKASLMLRRRQRYHRDDINQVAAWLGIEPFELLLPPDVAYHIRRLRNAVDEEYRLRAVADQKHEFKGAPGEPGAGPNDKNGA